ncbi:MAG: CmcI family methyltransferase [Terriglobales bacterium]
MSTSADQPPRARHSSTIFFRVLAVTSLALACGELLLTLQYRRELASPRYAEGVTHAFQKVYYNSHVWNRDTKWLGIPTQQAPTDNWEMQELITEIRPDYVIETGTLYGGATLFYADVLSHVNPQGKVITIDIDPKVEDASKVLLWKEHVEVVVGSSVDPKVTDHVAQEVLGKKVLVTLDSLHTRAHVLKEMEIYSNLVTPGSYLVVQDTAINGNPVYADFGPGPHEAVQEFLRTHENFMVDRSREKFLLTFYPGGWLKRIK